MSKISNQLVPANSLLPVNRLILAEEARVSLFNRVSVKALV